MDKVIALKSIIAYETGLEVIKRTEKEAAMLMKGLRKIKIKLMKK